MEVALWFAFQSQIIGVATVACGQVSALAGVSLSVTNALIMPPKAYIV